VLADPDDDEYDTYLESFGGTLDVEAFSLEETRALVRQCASLMALPRTPVKVIRMQPRKQRKRG
jgi:hypothetical protein